MRSDELLVYGRWLFTGQEVIGEGAALVQGGRVVEVGPLRELSQRYPEARRYGSRDHMVIPGLINAHHHGGGAPVSLHGVEDQCLEPWLLATQGMRGEAAYPATALAAARMLRSGITSVVDMTVIGGSVETARRETEERLRAYGDAGLAAHVAPGFLEKSFLISGDGEDERFLASLPAALQRRVREQLSLSPEFEPEEYLQLIADIAANLSSSSFQRIWYGPPGPQWTGPELLTRILEEARRQGLRIQTHALESFYEKLEGARSHGKGTVEWLAEIGVLDSRLTLAHGVWLTEREIALLSAAGTAVSHNPSSNLRLRSGVAPLNAMRAAGVPLAVGLDANGLNDDDDFFTELRLAWRLHREPGLQGDAPSAADIMEMATGGGAYLLGAEGRLGRIAAEYRADIVLLRTERMLAPWYEPRIDPLKLLLTRAKADDVDTVLVAGEPVLRGGRPVYIDEGAATEALVRQLHDTPPPDRLRGLIGELKPYLEEWYRSWQHAAAEPYAAFNSRR
jgi:cytosine/adenosine deaminase-related metal-dependent hydrolase